MAPTPERRVPTKCEGRSECSVFGHFHVAESGLAGDGRGSHNFTIASNNGTSFRVNTSTTAAGADIGFGHAGAAFAGLTVNSSKVSVLDANGTTNTQAISFSALTYGTDDQSLTVSANDANGALQTKTITLQNDATSRAGRSLDETIGLINTQLQQSNNPTLQKIVAVKENDGSGGKKINFISSLASFSVGVGSSANGNALNGGTAASEKLAGSRHRLQRVGGDQERRAVGRVGGGTGHHYAGFGTGRCR